MEVKKKLEGTYLPEQSARKEKVMLALSGGMDSYVAAYLLKIQKYELYAVAVVNQWDNWEGNASEVLSCHIDQVKLGEITEFCQRLNIPLSVIKSGAEFREEVIDPWFADRLSGKLPNPCWYCHDLRLRLLHKKMKETGVKYLATGHYAKLFHQDGGNVFVHTANDEANDQSGILSRLPVDILRDLLLPLSDLTKKEVMKLSENFGVISQNRSIKMHECLNWNPSMRKIFESNIPSSFLTGGDVLKDDDHVVGTHHGVFELTYGSSFEIREKGKAVKNYVGEYFYQDKSIKLVGEEHFQKSKLILTDCHFALGTSWVEPFKGFVVLSQNNSIECWVHAKSLFSVFLELAESVFIKEGEILSVVKKKGKNSKVFLTGKVNFLSLASEHVEGEDDVEKIDRNRDY